MATPNRIPELVLPAASLTALRYGLVAEVGPDAAARALQRAGHAAGDAVLELLGTGPADSAPSFWSRLDELFASRGWGHLAHEAVHTGVGALESSDWAEADPASGAARPSCFFTMGLLANVLGGIAGDEVGVLEVECRSRGDLRCRFVFGARSALLPLHRSLAEGRSVDEALGTLG